MWLLAMAFGAVMVEAQSPATANGAKPDNYVAIDQCKTVKPPDGYYEESHVEYHCTLHFAVADASKGKACILTTLTPPATYQPPCQVKDQQRYEEELVITVGSPAQAVYTVKQGDTVIGAVTVKWDELHEWLTITGNYGGNYKPTSPCAGTKGGSC